MKPATAAWLALMLAACERPWTLVETDNLSARLVALSVAGDDVLAGSDEGEVLHRPVGADEFGVVPALDGRGQVLGGSPVLGFARGPGDVVYAWMPAALLKSSGGGSFTAVAPPVDADDRPITRSWVPLAALVADDTLWTATRVGDGPGARHFLLRGDPAGGWERALFADGEAHDVTWLTRDPAGTLFAGDGHDEARALFRFEGGSWRQLADVGVASVVRAAAAGDRIFLLNPTGVRGVRVDDPGVILSDLVLPGVFDDLCAMPDGRVVVVGYPQAPWFPMWILDGDRWANVNTGTRQALHAVHCGTDGVITAAGDSGMIVSGPP